MPYFLDTELTIKYKYVIAIIVAMLIVLGSVGYTITAGVKGGLELGYDECIEASKNLPIGGLVNPYKDVNNTPRLREDIGYGNARVYNNGDVVQTETINGVTTTKNYSVR